ncbi:MAG TPA: hypothetical protein VFT58_03610 [Nitrososphaera sp.]|nr:hypothetical protein [uncultured Nitrososphaera sp.]HEU4984704.1 hypothetical protein [Nitrososphaera sp.]
MPRKSEYRCFVCKQKFESLGDMQKHIVVEHLQKVGFAKEIGNKKKEAHTAA